MDQITMTKLEFDAMVFASLAHAEVGQLRKYTDEPYIVHPAEAVWMLKLLLPDSPPEMFAALWLHDVVEDTKRTILEIMARFGDKVAAMVDGMTHVTTVSDGPRAFRKEIERARLASQPAEVQTLKCVDVWSNSRTISKFDLEFAKIYVPEMVALLEAMRKADPICWAVARDSVREAEKQLAL